MASDRILTITEQIVQKLRDDIYSEKLLPSSPVKETEIAERFGVSRGPVKQAFIQLTKEGLLESKPNIGVKVAEKPNEEVYKILVSLRKKIERFAVSNLIDTLTEDDKDGLDNQLEEIRLAFEADDAAALREGDFNLHAYIIRRYEDIHLYDTWNFLILRMMMRYLWLRPLEDSYKEHKLIVEAIKNGDKKTALNRIEKNIENTPQYSAGKK